MQLNAKRGVVCEPVTYSPCVFMRRAVEMHSAEWGILIVLHYLFQEVLKQLQGSIEEESIESSGQIDLLERLKGRKLNLFIPGMHMLWFSSGINTGVLRTWGLFGLSCPNLPPCLFIPQQIYWIMPLVFTVDRSFFFLMHYFFIFELPQCMMLTNDFSNFPSKETK